MARKKKAEAELVDGLAAETMESVQLASESKALKKAVKAEKKALKRAVKAQKKADKKAAKHPDESVTDGGHDASLKTKSGSGITATNARKAVNVTKVLLPAVIPVVAPLAVRAAGACREAYDKHQARKLGVDVDSLGEYSGHGGALHARIAGLSDGLAELRASGDDEGVRFAGSATSTVRQLSSAVRAAERMPAARRKEAHRAVATELDELEAQLLHHLGV